MGFAPGGCSQGRASDSACGGGPGEKPGEVPPRSVTHLTTSPGSPQPIAGPRTWALVAPVHVRGCSPPIFSGLLVLLRAPWSKTALPRGRSGVGNLQKAQEL